MRASVTLDYDDAATDETEETYDPDQTATLAMQRTEQTSGAQPVAAGVPGTASNAPNTQSLPVYPRQTAPPETSKSESGTYGVSKSVRHVLQNPGRVRRMTAAIVVNDRLLHADSKTAVAQWQPWSTDQLHNLTLLAQASVGFDPGRGDVLTIEDLAFEENRALPPPSLPTRLLRATEDFPLLMKYGALLAGLLVVVAFGVRPALKLARTFPPNSRRTKGSPPELHADAPPQLTPAEPPPLDPERQRSQEIFEQVTEHLKREPTQSSRLLQSWIHSD